MKMKFDFVKLKNFNKIFSAINSRKDILWIAIWLTGIIAFYFWNLAYLNEPSLRRIETGFFNTLTISTLAAFFSMLLAWIATMSIYFVGRGEKKLFLTALEFPLNLIRSIPQIIGTLIGYIFLTYLIVEGKNVSSWSISLMISFVVALFVFLELMDLLMDRINHFNRSDFYRAMISLGVSEFRIINYDILWKNSLPHIFHKAVSIIGIAIFLQCSVDFIVSVGLSSSVNLSNFPVTLGNMLASLDSKQDILAIGTTLMNPAYIDELFTRHLQGLSVAFLIVFTLLAVYKISNGILARIETR